MDKKKHTKQYYFTFFISLLCTSVDLSESFFYAFKKMYSKIYYLYIILCLYTIKGQTAALNADT